MIVVRRERGYELVTQPDHAALAADLLSAWPTLAGCADRDLILRATRLHDNGWQELDSAPRVGADGRPLGFREISATARRQLWIRGVERYRERDPECALLIAQHAQALHRRATDPELRRLLMELEDQQLRIGELLGPRAREIRPLYPWLALADTLSLMACERWRNTVRVEQPPPNKALIEAKVESPTRNDPSIGLYLDPFPLAGPTTFPLSKRLVSRERFATDTDLAVALARARWLRGHLRVQPSP